MFDNVSKDWPVFLVGILFTSAVIYLIIDGVKQEKATNPNNDKNKGQKEERKTADNRK